jgi:hypothetical protein
VHRLLPAERTWRCCVAPRRDRCRGRCLRKAVLYRVYGVGCNCWDVNVFRHSYAELSLTLYSTELYLARSARRHNRSSESQLQTPWNQLLQITFYHHSTNEYQLKKSNAKCSTYWKSRSLSSTGDSGFKVRNTQNTKIIKRMLRICLTLQRLLDERHQNQLAMLTRTSSTSDNRHGEQRTLTD